MFLFKNNMKNNCVTNIYILIFLGFCSEVHGKKSEGSSSDSIGEVRSYRHNINQIANGRNAGFNDVPYIVSLEGARSPHGREMAFCAGSIIASTWVITAAHCLRGGYSVRRIRAGTLFIEIGGFINYAKKKYIYPKFRTDHDHDIALIMTKNPFPRQENLAKIQMSTGGLTSGSWVYTSGWGNVIPARFRDKNKNKEDKIKSLRYSFLKVWKNHRCVEYFKKYEQYFSPRYICAGASRESHVKHDPCHGESGGPLVNYKSGELVGILSWHKKCGIKGYPVAYTSVYAYRKWIKAVLDIQKRTTTTTMTTTTPTTTVAPPGPPGPPVG